MSVTDTLNEDVFSIESIENQMRLVSEYTLSLAQFVPFACCARMLSQEREHLLETGMIAFGLFDSEIDGTAEEDLNQILFRGSTEPKRHRRSRRRAVELH